MKTKLIQHIADMLIKRNETVAVAESVTAGLIMNYFSLADNASDFFQGGVVAYNLGQKTRHLGVDPIDAQRTNCVSTAVVQTMAAEVSKQFSATWGIAISGYAAPVPALKIKKCFAYFCLTMNGTIIRSDRLETAYTQQHRVQRLFADKLLDAFDTYLTRLIA